MITRRQFLGTSLAAGSFVALGPREGRARRLAPAAGPKRILILGGTGFLGPACMEAALARGHSITLFNSGSTEERRKSAGRPSVIPAGVEVLHGNRDPERTADDRRLQRDPQAKPDPASPKGLTQLQGKTWDAVIDTSGYWPRMVKASAELLAPNVSQYVFISTISVYKRNDLPGMDESGELAVLADPKVEDFGANFENYGGGKVLCEAAVEAALPGRTTNIRPGYIVGKRDSTRRFLYWPWRLGDGGEAIVPGTPEDPVQIIDVRDLAEWTVHCIEQGVVGVYNATGPATTLTMKAMLEGCRAAVGGEATCTWVDTAFLAEHGIGPEAFPIWASPEGETAGFHRIDVSKAVKNGLRFRSVEDTARSAMEWYASLPEELQAQQIPQPLPATPEREAELLELWRARKG
jgi:2'-hydroxyisoflavone reductase